MDVIIIMCIGVLIGNRFLKPACRPLNEKLQVVCTVLLIFSMGVMLGSRENFLQELASIGIESVIFCIFPILGSVICVYLLTRFLMEDRKGGED